MSSQNSFSSLPDDDPGPNPPSTQDCKQTKFISKLKILCVNCQSIVNKKLEFHSLIDKENPDIIAGTESWLKKEHYSSEIFPAHLGYTVYRNDRPKGKGGGVFILVKSNILSSEQPKLKTDCEIIWIKLELKGCKPLFTASYYRPHELDDHSIDEFEKSLLMANKLKGNILVLGDFNFPKFAWDHEHNPTIKPGHTAAAVYDKFQTILDDFSLTQMVTKNTRHDSTLDLLLTSNHTLVNSVSIIPGISDHDIISSSVNVRPNILKQKPRSIPVYKKARWEEFRQFMNDSKRSILENANNISVDEIWVKFRDAIECGVRKFIPSKTVRSKRSLPWITKDIRKLINKRDKLYHKLKHKNSSPNSNDKFKTIKSLIKTKIKQAHNKYLESILGTACDENSENSSQNRSTTKKLYSLIKNSKQDSQNVSQLKDPNTGVLKSNNRDKANLLNNQFFSAFSPRNPLSLKQTCTQLLQKAHPSSYCRYPQMPDIVIHPNGILKLLSNLKPDKAAGPDCIKPLVLKELRNEIAEIVFVIFQKSLSTGKIPMDWTRAFVSPIFKKGDSSDSANYRPISLTCILCKTLEHIIASNVSDHLSKHDILFDLQHGFREKRSCETQLIQLTDELTRNTSTGNQTDLILLDFSKAFDKVNHRKLIFKLQEYGICPQVLKWSEAFLCNRKQTVVLDGEFSKEVPVTSGVPQGSVLGPLYFLIYINDLPSNITSQVRLFADDTAVYLTINSPEDTKTLQEDLHKLEIWEAEWDMEFNPTKCQVLHISKSKTKLMSQYTLHGQILESTTSAKYLGVDITSDLNWNSHISRITTNANKTLGFIKRNIVTNKMCL